jgi:hypothetical protein
MAAGLVSIVLPFLPSIPMIWLGIFLYAIASNFEKIDNSFLLLISVLTLAVIFMDYIVLSLGLRQYRFSIWGIIGAVIGGIIGSFFNLFLALIVGPILGAVVGQILSGQDMTYVFQMKKYTIIGFIGGTITKITVGVAMIGLFIWKLVS